MRKEDPVELDSGPTLRNDLRGVCHPIGITFRTGEASLPKSAAEDQGNCHLPLAKALEADRLCKLLL